MTLHVLDTDTLSLYGRGHPDVVRSLRALAPNERALTVISVEEQLSGWYALLRRARRRDQIALAYARLAEAVEVMTELLILRFTEPAIDRFNALVALRLGVGNQDLRIAAITLEHGGILVTRNVRDFTRVPGLPVVNWAP